MTNKQKWKIAGFAYFTILLCSIPALSLAYIDPSVTTYAIQAIASVVVAASAFFAAYGRRIRKSLINSLGLDENLEKDIDPPIEIYREDLAKDLAEIRSQVHNNNIDHKSPKGRFITAILCGLALSMTLVLRPIISFYLSNEGEFWFKFSDVVIPVLIIFAGVMLITALIHALLPDRKKISLRLIYAVTICVIMLCTYIQNHFMSSWLPVLTGDPIDWNLYQNWNIASILLWGIMLILFIILMIVKPRWVRLTVYALFSLVFIAEALTCGIDLITAKHDNIKADAYFSQKGMYESSDAGNVVVLISDTFEGTYMNEILEKYPETKDLLYDCTYYDNVSGVSVFTYFSYAKLLTGNDFPVGAKEQAGISWCFENQTTIDQIRNNGWNIAYFSDFSPTPNLADKILNYSDGLPKPDNTTAWAIAKRLWKSTLFQSAPQPIKPLFLVYTSEYETLKKMLPKDSNAPDSYVEDDPAYYKDLLANGLNRIKNSKPIYSVVQLYGVHNPVEIDEQFNHVEYTNDVSLHDRKIIAGLASLNLMRAYLDELKKAGTYDQTTVIMTADHGQNMRFYPMFLVKEAQTNQTSFKVDNTPISLQEDYAQLINGLTSGKSFSNALNALNIPEHRTRYALDFRSTEGYAGKTNRKSIVLINGDAKDEFSYFTEKDVFYLDDDYSGRYMEGLPFITNRKIDNGLVNVYGISDEGIYGHSVVFDVFFESEEKRDLNLRMTVTNITDYEQQMIFEMNGIEIDNVSIPGNTQQEIVIPLPTISNNHCTIQFNIPDALLKHREEGSLGWNAYDSFFIDSAVLEK